MKRFFPAALSLILILMCVSGIAEDYDLTAKGYVLVCTATESKWFALADEETGEYSFTVKQTSNGEEMTNTIVIDTEGVTVTEANCDNQDCVDEGKVTLENKADRVLGNMIVCLPHQLTVELYSREELIESLSKDDASTGSESEAAQ